MAKKKKAKSRKSKAKKKSKASGKGRRVIGVLIKVPRLKLPSA